jgi:hypothetical protein
MSDVAAAALFACDEEYELPSLDALVAGTLALMTGYAQAPEEGAHRPLMARKLVSNLFFLSEHPQLSPPMRCLLARLRTRWQAQLAPSPGDPPCESEPASVDQGLWHRPPAQVQ